MPDNKMALNDQFQQHGSMFDCIVLIHGIMYLMGAYDFKIEYFYNDHSQHDNCIR